MVLMVSRDVSNNKQNTHRLLMVETRVDKQVIADSTNSYVEVYHQIFQ